MQTVEQEQDAFPLYGEVIDFPTDRERQNDHEAEPFQFTLKLGPYTQQVETIEGFNYISLTGNHWFGRVRSVPADSESGSEIAQIHILNIFRGESLFVLF